MRGIPRVVHYTNEERLEIFKRFGLSFRESNGIVEAIQDATFKDIDQIIDALMVIAKRRKPIKLD